MEVPPSDERRRVSTESQTAREALPVPLLGVRSVEDLHRELDEPLLDRHVASDLDPVLGRVIKPCYAYEGRFTIDADLVVHDAVGESETHAGGIVGGVHVLRVVVPEDGRVTERDCANLPELSSTTDGLLVAAAEDGS